MDCIGRKKWLHAQSTEGFLGCHVSVHCRCLLRRTMLSSARSRTAAALRDMTWQAEAISPGHVGAGLCGEPNDIRQNEVAQ